MSQEDAQAKEIDGFTYDVSPLDPLVANDIWLDLVHVAGPTIGGLVGAFSKGGIDSALDNDPDPETLSNAIGGLFQRIEKQKMREIMNTLASVTVVRLGNGKAPQLNQILKTHFRGKLGLMYEWLWFALSVQYSDFFARLKPAIAAGMNLVAAAGRSSRTDTSEPGS